MEKGERKYRYDAFVSYSSGGDREVAAALKRGLQKLAKPWYRRRAIHVYLDQSNLHAEEALWGTLTAALDDSRSLVLVASPHAAASSGVGQEAEHWVKTRENRATYLALSQGTIVWDSKGAGTFDWERTDAVPRAIAPAFAKQPKWVDVRASRGRGSLTLRDPEFKSAVAMLAAPIRGKSLEDLIGQDVREHRRAVVTAWVAVLLILGAAGLAWVMFGRAREQTLLAEQRLSEKRTSSARAYVAQAAIDSAAERGAAAFAAVTAAHAEDPSVASLVDVVRSFGHAETLIFQTERPFDGLDGDFAVLPSGDLLGVAGSDLVEWRARTGEVVRRATGRGGRDAILRLSADATTAAILKPGGELTVLRRGDPDKILLLLRVDPETEFALSPAGDRLALVTDQVTLHLLATSDGKLLAEHTLEASLWQGPWFWEGPDRLVYVTTEDGVRVLRFPEAGDPLVAAAEPEPRTEKDEEDGEEYTVEPGGVAFLGLRGERIALVDERGSLHVCDLARGPSWRKLSLPWPPPGEDDDVAWHGALSWDGERAVLLRLELKDRKDRLEGEPRWRLECVVVDLESGATRDVPLAPGLRGLAELAGIGVSPDGNTILVRGQAALGRGHELAADDQPRARAAVARCLSVSITDPAGPEAPSPPAYSPGVTRVAFAARAPLVALGDRAGGVTVLAREDGETTARASLGNSPVASLAFGDSDRTVAGILRDGTVFRMEIGVPSPPTTARLSVPGEVQDACLAADGRTLYVSLHEGATGHLIAADPADGALHKELPTLGQRFPRLALAPDDSALYGVSELQILVRWDLVTGAAIQSAEFGVPATSLALARGGRTVVVALQTGALLELDARFLTIASLTGPGPIGTYEVCGCPGSDCVALASSPFFSEVLETHVQVFDLAAQRYVRRIPVHDAPITTLAASPDGSEVVTASLDGRVRLHRLPTGARWHGPRRIDREILRLERPLPEGRLLARRTKPQDGGGPEEPLVLLGPGSDRILATLASGQRSPAKDAIPSPDGRRVALFEPDADPAARREGKGTVLVYATATGALDASIAVVVMGLSREGKGLGFDLSGQRLVAAPRRSSRGKPTLYDVGTGQTAGTLTVAPRARDPLVGSGDRWWWRSADDEIHEGNLDGGDRVVATVPDVEVMVLTRDGRRLVLQEDLGGVVVLDVQNGMIHRLPLAPGASAKQIVPMHDPDLLALVTPAGEVQVWSVPERELCWSESAGANLVTELVADPEAPILSAEALAVEAGGHRIEVFDLERALLARRHMRKMAGEEIREFGRRLAEDPHAAEASPSVAALEEALREQRLERLGRAPPWYARSIERETGGTSKDRASWIRTQLLTQGRVEAPDARRQLAEEWTKLTPEDAEAWAWLSSATAQLRMATQRWDLAPQVLDAMERALALGVTDNWQAILGAWAGEILHAHQRQDEAIPHLLEARRGATPGAAGLWGHEVALVDCFSRLGRYEEAAEAARVARSIPGLATDALERAQKTAELNGVLASLQPTSPRLPAYAVTAVRPGSPAEKAGFAVGDVILAVDAQGYVIPAELNTALTQMLRPPDTTTSRPQRVRVWRKQEERDLDVSMGAEGVEFGALFGRMATAAVLTQVEDGSLAARAGLRVQDIVVRMGDEEIRNVGEFLRAWKSAPRGESVRIVVLRAPVDANGVPPPVAGGTEEDVFSQWAYTRHEIDVVKDADLLRVLPILYTMSPHRGLHTR